MAFELAVTLLSTVFSLAAVVFAFLLSKETRGEKYWVFFLVAAMSFLVAHISAKGFLLGFSSSDLFLVQEIAEIVGGFSLAYATFGLYASMKRIRERTSKELEG